MAIKRNKKYNNVYSIGGIASTAATVLGGVLAGQNQSGVGNAMQSIGSLTSNIPGVGGIVGAGVNLLGGITNAVLGSHLNQENIDRIEGQVNDLNSFQSVASDYDALSSEYSNAPIMGYFSKDAIGSDGWFSNKAENKWRDLLNEKSKAEDWVQRSLANNALNIANNTLSSMEANYTAYGGPLTMRYSGLMSPFGNQFESGGGIHIKKKNRGKFTSYCGGKVTNACIQRGLHSSNPTTRKRANFARNARGWKHADGGGLYTDKELFANDIYNAYKLRLLRDNINPEQAHRVATYMTMQSAGESGYGSSKASKGYNYAGHLSEGEGSAPKVYKSFDDFVDYHYTNLKNNWPDFINSSSVEDFYNKIHTGKKYSNDSRDKYLNLIKGTGDRVNRYLNSYNNSYESYLKSLPPNLRNTDPNLYDLTEAYKGGLRPEYSKEDKSYHLGSRNPKTGKYLKKAAHPTFLKGLLTDASLGYFPYIKDGQLYTDTWEGNKKSMGGNLTHGGIFDNGLLSVDSGGTHEENPFEGVQLGVDPQGVPNLVEEGEVVYNDYVFSNRMRVPKAIRHKYKLRDNITFADAAKYLSKESKERPNDPISQNGLDASLSDLAQVQEDIRIKKQAREDNKMALGGLLSAAFGSNADNYRTAKGNLEFGMYGSSNPYAEGGPLDYTVDDLLGSKVVGNPFAPNLEKAALNNKVSSSTLNEAKRLSYPENTSLAYLRYAPILGSAFATVSDIFSSPDYSAADRVSSVNIRPTYIKATPVSHRLKYSPFDRLLYINQLNKSTAANRSAMKNISGGNRATALAGILASDMNYGDNLGKLARQAEEYNQALDERVNTFNRATDMFNVQQSLQAQSANAQALSDATKMKLAQAEEVAKLRQAAKNAYDVRRSTNLNNFINNLGNLGWEEQQGDWLDNLARRGVLMMDTSGRYTGHSKGGKLNKRRRTTYA